MVSQGCAEPRTLTAALVQAHARSGPFETFTGPLFSRTFDGADDMRFASYGAMGGGARLARAGRLDICPCTIARSPRSSPEVNAQGPWCCGAQVEGLRVDHLIGTDRSLVTLPPVILADAERRIGRHVAGLVDDRATLQLGIGALSDAILAALSDHRDLDVDSEMIADRLVPWVVAIAVPKTDVDIVVTEFGVAH